MTKHLQQLLLFVFFGLISTTVFSQRRPCTVPTVTLIPTITHATCFNPQGSIEFTISTSADAYLGSLKLFDEQGTVVYEHGDNSMSGIATGLPLGMYRFVASVVVEYQCNGLGYITSVPIDMNVWLGVETVWTEKIDMIALPNSYSAKRNASTSTYGGVRSSNGIDSGDGWVEMKAQYGTTTDNRVYWLVGETNPLGTFSTGGSQQYIEFFEGSGGNGIQVRHETSTSGIYTTSTLSTNQDDKVRLIRSGSVLTVQLNDDPTTVFTFPQNYSGGMNIAVRSLAQGDGCLDAVSSFPCQQMIDQMSYAELKKKLDGGRTFTIDDILKFTFDGEYEVSSALYLGYNIYDKNQSIVGQSDDQGTVMSGSTALNYAYEDNRYELDVSGMSLTADEYYTLEVIDSKGMKRYLKFIYKH